jgi:hypothetical protein
MSTCGHMEAPRWNGKRSNRLGHPPIQTDRTKRTYDSDHPVRPNRTYLANQTADRPDKTDIPGRPGQDQLPRSTNAGPPGFNPFTHGEKGRQKFCEILPEFSEFRLRLRVRARADAFFVIFGVVAGPGLACGWCACPCACWGECWGLLAAVRYVLTRDGGGYGASGCRWRCPLAPVQRVGGSVSAGGLCAPPMAIQQRLCWPFRVTIEVQEPCVPARGR